MVKKANLHQFACRAISQTLNSESVEAQPLAVCDRDLLDLAAGPFVSVFDTKDQAQNDLHVTAILMQPSQLALDAAKDPHAG